MARRGGDRRTPSTAQVPEDPKRRRPRQERARVTVASIVEAAELLLVEVGYAAASTNAIARRAGVSIGSLYQYFADKEAVFQAVLDRHHGAMRPIEERAVGALIEGDDLRAVLERALEESLAERARNPELMVALVRELEPVAARWPRNRAGSAHDTTDALASTISRRVGIDEEEARLRGWLAAVVMDAVGRRLVHGPLEDRGRNRVGELVTEMIASMVESP